MIYDAYTGNIVKPVEGHTGVVSCLTVSDVSGTICTGSWDSTGRSGYDTHTYMRTRTHAPIHACAYTFTVTTWDVEHPSYWEAQAVVPLMRS